MCVNPSIYTVIVYYWKASCCDYCGDLGRHFVQGSRSLVRTLDVGLKQQLLHYFFMHTCTYHTHMWCCTGRCCTGNCGNKNTNLPLSKIIFVSQMQSPFCDKKNPLNQKPGLRGGWWCFGHGHLSWVDSSWCGNHTAGEPWELRAERGAAEMSQSFFEFSYKIGVYRLEIGAITPANGLKNVQMGL